MNEEVVNGTSQQTFVSGYVSLKQKDIDLIKKIQNPILLLRKSSHYWNTKSYWNMK